jgi:hypothetical protein
MSGLKGYFAMKGETTYGTAVVPTEATEINSEAINDSPEFAQAQPVRRGVMAPNADRRVRTFDAAAGNIPMDLLTKGMVRFLALAHPGAVGAPVETPAASGAWLYELRHGRPNWDQKSITAVVGRPRRDGTIVPFTYLGGVLTGYTLTMPGGNDFVTFTPEFDFREGRTDIAEPPALTYPTDVGGFVLEHAELLIDGVEPAALIRSGSITCNFPQETGRRGYNTQRRKRRPTANGPFAGTASFQCEFEDPTFVNAAKEPNRIHTIRQKLIGTNPIAAGVFPYVETTLLVGYSGAPSPNIGGNELLTQELPFVILDRPGVVDAPVVHKVLTAEPTVTV